MAAAEQLRAESIRLEHGESTPFDVLLREQDLVKAESQKIARPAALSRLGHGPRPRPGNHPHDRNIVLDEARRAAIESGFLSTAGARGEPLWKDDKDDLGRPAACRPRGENSRSPRPAGTKPPCPVHGQTRRPAIAEGKIWRTSASRSRIKGDLTGNEDLVIEGNVEGRVDLPNNQLTIGAERQRARPRCTPSPSS